MNKAVFDKDKIALVMDHFIPNKDIKSAENCKCVPRIRLSHMRSPTISMWASMGIEHALLPEKGLAGGRGCRDRRGFPYLHLRRAWVHFPPAWEVPIWRPAWRPERPGSRCPSAIKFELIGKPAKWVSGKDVILHIIGMIGVDGALYKSMEFVGDGYSVPVHGRPVSPSANMAIEAGGKNGIFPVDDKAIAYMKEHSSQAVHRLRGGCGCGV